MTLAAIIAGLVLIGLVKLAVDAVLVLAARDYVTNWPELRKAWLGKGSWVAFSRRYGLPYALALVAAAFVWVLATAKIAPNTNVGVLLVFGPSITMLVVGVALGMLTVARRIDDF